ncbi:YciI family protein [Chitinophagaceae bacterium LWZ2-11]
MFIIELTYKVPATVIDEHMAPHMSFVEKYYESGNFLASGRKEPRDGGIILAVAADKEHVKEIISEDPFYKKDLAEYRIIEFKATKKTKAFALLPDQE